MLLRAVVLVLAVLALHIQPARADWYVTGPIWNEVDAQEICPDVCSRSGWDGKWRTVTRGTTSACFCTDGGGVRSYTSLNPLGPRICVETEAIRNKLDAQIKCPGACGVGTWDGSWRRFGYHRATCGCSFRTPLEYHAISVGG